MCYRCCCPSNNRAIYNTRTILKRVLHRPPMCEWKLPAFLLNRGWCLLRDWVRLHLLRSSMHRRLCCWASSPTVSETHCFVCLSHCSKSPIPVASLSIHPFHTFRKLNTLNHTLFGGLPVLSSFGGKIAFNTAILQQNGRGPVVIVEAHYAVPMQTNVVYTAPAAPVQYAHVATPAPDQQYSKY